MKYPALKYAKGGKRSACSGKLRYGAACRSRKQQGDVAVTEEEEEDSITAAKRRAMDRAANIEAERKAKEMEVKGKIRENIEQDLENFDERTERKVIKRHERDMRRKYRAEGVDDPLQGQRTAGDLMNRLRGKDAPGQRIRRDRSREEMFNLGRDVDKEYNVSYSQGVYSNPRFMNQQRFVDEELSERARDKKIRRDRRKERKIRNRTEREYRRQGRDIDLGIDLPSGGGGRTPSGKTGNVVKDVGRAIGGGCRKVWDTVKKRWQTIGSGCGNSAAFKSAGGYKSLGGYM